MVAHIKKFRKLFPPTKWAAEFNTALTVPFFHWLVGPSEVVEVKIDGVKQRSWVHVKKCRCVWPLYLCSAFLTICASMVVENFSLSIGTVAKWLGFTTSTFKRFWESNHYMLRIWMWLLSLVLDGWSLMNTWSLMVYFFLLTLEREYFATSPDYGHLTSKMGSEYLAKLLSKELKMLTSTTGIYLKLLKTDTILALALALALASTSASTSASASASGHFVRL